MRRFSNCPCVVALLAVAPVSPPDAVSIRSAATPPAVNAAAIGAHLLGSIGQLNSNKGRVAAQQGVASMSIIKTLLTVAAITGASVLLAAWAAFRRAGPAVGLGAVALIAAVTWSTGTAVLTDPISSNVGGYPLLAGAALAWALWGDDRRLWPVAVAVWSFATQQHLAVLGPAAVVAAWGVLGAVATTTRAGRWRESWRWAAARPSTRPRRSTS